jgi:hypothetical protein
MRSEPLWSHVEIDSKNIGTTVKMSFHVTTGVIIMAATMGSTILVVDDEPNAVKVLSAI